MIAMLASGRSLPLLVFFYVVNFEGKYTNSKSIIGFREHFHEHCRCSNAKFAYRPERDSQRPRSEEGEADPQDVDIFSTNAPV